ncbi:MAG: nuclear transport factor 2 family protein [Actinomycetia bacterium]|nr:nuclear transport factor 2 family protein [Actinomycetes bacterium]MCP3911260.1 nuclear transport factor 2 family protein [Actinomycetes bacterium]MCP4085299.1 nuclear transport factor 2 family protein [Actinomycetes bacterium]
MGQSDDLARLLDERACERLINVYCQLVDRGEAAAMADLFTEDAVWRSTEGVVMTGRDEIRAGFLRRQGVTRRQSRHLCTNVVIDIDGDQATGTCYLVNFRHDSETGTAEHPAPADAPKYVGEYQDRFVRTPAGWRFTERVADMVFIRPSRL